MHELSIALSLVEMAGAAASEAGVTRINRVHLRLGVLSGVVRDALEFSFEIAASGTVLEGAELVIHPIPVEVYCPRCDVNSELPDIQRFRCPRCDTPTGRIIHGRELELEALEYDQEPAA